MLRASLSVANWCLLAVACALAFVEPALACKNAMMEFSETVTPTQRALQIAGLLAFPVGVAGIVVSRRRREDAEGA